MKTDEPRDYTTELDTMPAQDSADGAQQASESSTTTLDGEVFSMIEDRTEEWVKHGKGGFGIVGGVCIPPIKK